MKGRESYDSEIGNSLVNFINKNSSQYPTEVGSANFAPVPVTQQKDLMINAARLYANQEYNRIMELVSVLQKQANEIKKRLDITDMVHSAKYDFQPYPGQKYWLVYDTRKKFTRLCRMGPTEYSTSPPKDYDYICQVQWLGDYTWIEVQPDE